MSKFVTLHGFGGSGGGAELNFEVVASTTEPMNPNENTIWVNTDVNVTNYDFNINEPENPVQGTVWIYIGTSSQVEFNALKENALHVYPISAKQYVSGAWVDVEVKSYQNGEWVDWITYLYNAGDECTDITGGWEKYQSGGTLKKESSKLRFVAGTDTGNTYGYAVGTANAIDLTNASKVKAIVKPEESSYKSLYTLSVFSNKSYTKRVAYVTYVGDTSKATIQVELDVSALSGSYFIGITNGSLDSYAELHKAWLQ